MPAAAGELFHWHARPGAFERLVPPWQRVEITGGSPAVEDGSRLEITLRKGPLRVRWVAEHSDVEPGRGFRDVQVSGPFAFWQHDHLFEPTDGAESVLRDRILYRPPGGAVGRLLLGSAIRRDLDAMFSYRHRTTVADLELHRRFRNRTPLTVAVSGASGLIGSALAAVLTTGGHRVVRLVRRAGDDGPDTAHWSPGEGVLEPERLAGVDAVVHLAGESIAGGRWTARRRQRIRRSRIEGTRNLVASLGRMPRPPRCFVCASAIGFYGDRGAGRADESTPGGGGFLAEVCAAWEHEALAARAWGMRTALARFGVVLSPRGGLLRRLLPPFRLGLGGRLGDGRQAVSWVSIDDAAAALVELLHNDALDGPVNVTSPEPVTNRQLTATLAAVLRRPALAPVPAAAARLAFGRMADELMLSGARVVPGALEAAGFRFRHPALESALRHLLGRRREPAADS